MLSINWSDVWKMVESVKVPLIVIGVALALAIIVSLAVFTLDKPQRKLARSTSWVAAFVAVVVAVVSMMYGGFKTVLDLASGSGVLTEASKAQVEDLGNDIADEGMVLLKNNDGALPLAQGAALNVGGGRPPTRSTVAQAPARCPRTTPRRPCWTASTTRAERRTMN